MLIKILTFTLGLSAVIHFACVCNFMPSCATRKIKIAALGCVAAGAACCCVAARPNAMEMLTPALLLLVSTFALYETCRWVDGFNLCDFYNKNSAKNSRPD